VALLANALMTSKCLAVCPDRRIGGPKLSVQEADIRWRYVIESYTELDLSFEGDVFPALQGLAKMMPSGMGFYLAGLWSRTVQYNLTWHVRTEDKHDRSIRTMEWRAPTWSWASTTGSIGWMRHTWTQQQDQNDQPMSFITVVNAVTSPVAEDATGQLTSGELILRGHCLPGRMYHPMWCQSSRTICLHIRCSERELCMSSYDKVPVIWSDAAHAVEQFSTADGLLATADLSTAHFLPPSNPMSAFAYFSRKLNPLSSDGRRLLLWDYHVDMEGPHQVRSGSEILILKVEGFITHDVSELAWIVLRSVDDRLNTFERLGLLYTRDLVDEAELERAANLTPEREIRIV